MGASVATETTLPRNHQCRLCESPEYDTAKRLLKRSGLNPEQWGFLLHDITAQLQEQQFYELNDDVRGTQGRLGGR